MADIPISLDDATQNAQDSYQALDGLLSDLLGKGFAADTLAGIGALVVFLGDLILLLIVKGIIKVAAPFATGILQVIGKVREENADGFNEVVAASMSELLSVDVSASDLASGTGEAAAVERWRTIGDKLHDLLVEEFGGLGPISPDKGADNARKFTGFGVNFATSAAFLAILAETSSVGILKDFGELGKDLGQSLGLGRLQRLALQPLIRNMIQQPYDLYLKKQLRPDRLADAQYVRAMARGDFDEQYVRERLAEKGFPDDEIDALIHEFTAKLQAGDLVKLIRYGEISQEDAVQQLVDQGTNKEIAEQMLKAQLLALADSRVMAYVQKIQQQRIEGWIDQAQFETMLEQVPLSDSAKEWERNLIGVIAEVPRRRISFAQLEKAVVAGHIDFTYVDEWLRAEGYSDNDQLVLTMQIIEAMQDAEAKTKAKAATHAKVSAKGKVPPPALQP